jgi:hypothetical protein
MIPACGLSILIILQKASILFGDVFFQWFTTETATALGRYVVTWVECPVLALTDPPVIVVGVRLVERRVGDTDGQVCFCTPGREA